MHDLRNGGLEEAITRLNERMAYACRWIGTVRLTHRSRSGSRHTMHIMASVRADPDIVRHIARTEVGGKLGEWDDLLHTRGIVTNIREVLEGVVLLHVE